MIHSGTRSGSSVSGIPSANRQEAARDIAAGDAAVCAQCAHISPNVGLPLTQRNAQLVTREYGYCRAGKTSPAEVDKRLGKASMRAIAQARRIIRDNRRRTAVRQLTGRIPAAAFLERRR